MRVLILTYGTRGDIQPFVALGAALLANGHPCDICTHGIFESFIRDYGLGFVPYCGENPQDMFNYCVKEGIFSTKFLREIPKVADRWMDEWAAVCRATVGKYDLVLSTFTSCNFGVLIAEASGVPVCITHYVPVGETMHFFNPYAPVGLRRTASRPSYLNLFSHHLIEFFHGKLALPKTNVLRQELGLPPIRGFHWGAGFHMKNDAPRLYAYSPALLPAPPDWPTNWRVVGYWWLPEKPYTPPDDLQAFLEAGSAPVYVGYGSVYCRDYDRLNSQMAEACRIAGERALMFVPHTADLPPSNSTVLWVKYSIPHDWLFPRCKLAVHHGGAGTVAYALKAAIPSIIVPFFGDHHIWACRLHEMGCGPPAVEPSQLTPALLSATIRSTLADKALLERVAAVSRGVAKDDALREAVRCLEHLHAEKEFPPEGSRKPRAAWRPLAIPRRWVEWGARRLMDRLQHKLRAAICLAAGVVRNANLRLMYAPPARKHFATYAPKVLVHGPVTLSAALSDTFTKLRVTPAPEINGQSYFKFQGASRHTLEVPVDISGAGYVIVDFGALTRAKLVLHIRSGAPAATVCVGLCEGLEGWRLHGDQYLAKMTGGSFSRPTIQAVGPGDSVVTTPTGTFRYAVVSAPAGALTLLKAVALSDLELEVPFGTPYPGNFRCSCPDLTRVWYAGVNTLELCSGGHPRVFLDGAKRDRWVWTGDLFVENLVAYVSNGDVKAAAASLALMAEHQAADGYAPHLVPPKGETNQTPSLPMASTMVFAEYCVWYVVVVWLHYLHTGDVDFAREFEPVVHRAMGWLCRLIAEDGLVHIGPEHGQTWHSPEMVLGRATDANGLMAHALDCANNLRLAAGKPLILHWVTLRKRMIDAINEHLWDENRGVYVNSEASDSIPTQDCVATLIWTGIASPDRARRSLRYLDQEHSTPYGPLTVKEDHPTMTSYISPFATFRHQLAMIKADDADGAVRCIRRLWVHMANSDPGNVFWEKVSREGKPELYQQLDMPPTFTSLCHGWAAGPTYVLSVLLLGVTPEAPGYSLVSVRPRMVDVEWAQGAVPTPHGGVVVAWQRFGPSHCLLRVTVPDGVTATVTFPLEGVEVVSVLPEGAAVADPSKIPLVGPATGTWSTRGGPNAFTFPASD